MTDAKTRPIIFQILNFKILVWRWQAAALPLFLKLFSSKC